MKTELWVVGKTSERYLEEGIAIYEKRLSHYLPFQIVVLPDVKKAGEHLKEKEGEMILNRLKKEDFFILLDEKGQMFSSEEFARFLERKIQLPFRRIVFQVGGAWGFAESVYQRANAVVSLSSMTFSHQMVRLFFVEQLYRAMTIIRNEPYHNV